MQTSKDRLPVYVDGRWGRRRLRVTECAEVLTAERVYDWLLGRGACSPGWEGEVRFQVFRATHSCQVVVVPNAVWRHGRVFLACASCNRRCTRLYMPDEGDPFACRQCWGLTYESTQRGNYKGHGESRLMRFLITRAVREAREAERYARWRARQQGK